MSNFFFKLYLVFQNVCCIVWYGFDKSVKGYFGLEDCGKKLWQQYLHIRFGAAACQDGSPPAHIYHFPPHAGQKLHIQNSINASQFTFYTLHGFGIYKTICVKEQYYEILYPTFFIHMQKYFCKQCYRYSHEQTNQRCY